MAAQQPDVQPESQLMQVARKAQERVSTYSQAKQECLDRLVKP